MTVKKKSPDQPPVFEKSRLIAQAMQVFKQPSEVVAGALYDITDAITIDQAGEKVEAFLSRPITTEGGK